MLVQQRTPEPLQLQEILPLLQDRQRVSAAPRISAFLMLGIGIVAFFLSVRLLIYLMRELLLPRFAMRREEKKFFWAMGHAFSLEEPEIELAKRLALREGFDQPYLVFCAPRHFDACFLKEMYRIQRKRFWSNSKKGRALNNIYQMRQKIF